jgi:hypothetical protein
MKKITYTTPYIRNVQVTSKSALFAGSDKTGTLRVHPDTGDGFNAWWFR